jgi:hypothetical protein
MRPLPALRRSSRHAWPAAAALCVTALVALGTGEAHAESCVLEDCLPTPNSAYAGSGVTNFFGAGISAELAHPSLHNFSACGSPPASVMGAFVTIGFNATMDFGLALNGSPDIPMTASANATMRVTFDHQAGSTRFFNTEMLALDISGGTLPAPFRFRESPTLPSNGATSIETLGGGQFRVDSFFDVFFEFSADSGVTWIPATSAGRLTLAGPGCPTPIRHHTWGRLKTIYR